MGTFNTTCCSTNEIVKPEEYEHTPVICSCPDAYVDDAVVHRSASEITRICLEDIQRN